MDYPVLTTVPETGFDCQAQQWLPGIYSDSGADCQVGRHLKLIKEKTAQIVSLSPRKISTLNFFSLNDICRMVPRSWKQLISQ